MRQQGGVAAGETARAAREAKGARARRGCAVHERRAALAAAPGSEAAQSWGCAWRHIRRRK